MDKSCYLTVETKRLKLKITSFGEEYKKNHPELNFTPSRGFIN